MDYSIVTSLYNGLEYTQSYLNSLDATMMGIDYELILIDDCSTDGTRDFLETLRSRSNTQILLNQENLGFARSNNRAGHHASGKYLIFLNNDVVLLPGWLEPMAKAFSRKFRWEGETRSCGVVGNVQRRVVDKVVDHAGIFMDTFAQPQHAFCGDANLPVSEYSSWSALTAACWMVEKDFFYDIGAFNEKYVNGCEDVDFCFKSLDAGRVNVCANKSIIEHAVSASRGESHDDSNNYALLWNLWRDRLQSYSHVDTLRLFWRQSSFLDKLKNPRKSLHALSSQVTHYKSV